MNRIASIFILLLTAAALVAAGNFLAEEDGVTKFAAIGLILLQSSLTLVAINATSAKEVLNFWLVAAFGFLAFAVWSVSDPIAVSLKQLIS